MKLGPPWRIAPERVARIDQFGPPVASVLAPLPAAVGAALVHAEPQAAITTLVMLSFPITLIVGILFLLARPAGLVGWAAAVVAGVIGAIVMMNLHDMQPPPSTVEAVRADGVVAPVGPTGALLQFVLPGVVTSLGFWLAIRIRSPGAFTNDAE